MSSTTTTDAEAPAIPDTTENVYRQYVAPVLAMLAAFVVYYCMYAFRKPYGAASWEGSFFGTSIGTKTSLAVSQVIGYALAKLIGTRICSGIRYDRILFLLLACILVAMAALLWLPYAGQFKVLPMFVNGLALGMIWGFVMRPLEGRKMTEALIAGLCISFIIASGDVKSTGDRIIQSEAFATSFKGDVAWMPLLTSMIYFPFLVAGVMVLFLMPRQTKEDEESRAPRDSMQASDRKQFLLHHRWLLIPLAVIYFLLTAYRDYRDTFTKEIFQHFGIEDAGAFSSTERYVALGVTIVLSIFIVIRDSRKALVVCHFVIAGGLVLCGIANLLVGAETISGYQWMVMSGLGAYICYIAFHCIVFERMVAYTRSPGNAVFAMMVFDFVGYIAAIGFMILVDIIGFKSSNHYEILSALSWVLTFVGIGATVFSLLQVRALEPVK